MNLSATISAPVIRANLPPMIVSVRKERLSFRHLIFYDMAFRRIQAFSSSLNVSLQIERTSTIRSLNRSNRHRCNIVRKDAPTFRTS